MMHMKSGQIFSDVVDDMTAAIQWGCKPTDASLRAGILSLQSWANFRDTLVKHSFIAEEKVNQGDASTEDKMKSEMYNEMLEIVETIVKTINKPVVEVEEEIYSENITSNN